MMRITKSMSLREIRTQIKDFGFEMTDFQFESLSPVQLEKLWKMGEDVFTTTQKFWVEVERACVKD